jgi:uncharacterized protein
MQITFDPAKDRINIEKHDVSLAVASELDWDNALVWVDDRFEYDELRMIALAPHTQVLYYVAFVEQEATYRIVSVRKATRKEVNHYVQNI